MLAAPSAAAVLPVATRLGRWLAEQRRSTEAHQLYAALDRHIPDQPIGVVGLAHVAMLQGAWTEAVSRWDEALQRFANRAQPDWANNRARAAAAVAAAPAIPQAAPAATPAAAQAAIARGIANDPFVPAAQRVEALIRSDRIPDARNAFAEALAAAREPRHFRLLLVAVATIFDHWERTNTLDV